MRTYAFRGITGCLFVTLLLATAGCTEQSRARQFGGTSNINLPADQKLIEVTWKDDGNLWYLTRPMRPDEEAESYRFRESSSYGMMEGTVIVRERESDSHRAARERLEQATQTASAPQASAPNRGERLAAIPCPDDPSRTCHQAADGSIWE